MEIETQYQNTNFFKKSTLISVIRKNKISPKESREREREREYSQFLCEKNMDWMEEMKSNLNKIKWEGKESNYKKEKMMNEV